MTNLPPLNRANSGVTSTSHASAVPRETVALTKNGSGPSSTRVSLNGGPQPVDAPNVLVWENRTRSTASVMMAQNLSTQPLAGRLQGLGGELLKQVAYDGNDFSQSVKATAASLQPDTYDMLVSPTQANQHGAGDNKFKLVVSTASGVKVELTLDANESGIAISAHSDGKLNDSERKALDKLSDAFEKAIDSLTDEPPHLNLAGLTQFDHFSLASVDLIGQVKLSPNETQNIELHANKIGRSLIFNGPLGIGHVAVDLGQPASWGSQAQRAKALDRYLHQVDLAGVRGQANSDALSMFKDAFAAMNSDYGAVTPSREPAIEFSDQDQAMTTGLADFDASFSQSPSSPNPARVTEKDSFSYEMSQNTKISGGSQRDRAISQEQRAHLSARYHMANSPDAKLALDLTPQSQNYKYVTIDDTASSTTNIAYDGGALKTATLEMQANQSTREAKYVLGKLKKDHTTPYAKYVMQDLLTTLEPEREGRESIGQSERSQLLSDINNKIFLQVNPDLLPQFEERKTDPQGLLGVYVRRAAKHTA